MRIRIITYTNSNLVISEIKLEGIVKIVAIVNIPIQAMALCVRNAPLNKGQSRTQSILVSKMIVRVTLFSDVFRHKDTVCHHLACNESSTLFYNF